MRAFNFGHAYVNQCAPPHPEITVCYASNCFPKLGLDVRRDLGHQPNELLLDGHNFVFREHIIACFRVLNESQYFWDFLVKARASYCPFPSDKILEI